MLALSGSDWTGRVPDEHRPEADYRVRVLALQHLERLDGLYFTRPRRARLLWNYLFEVGPVGVWRKVRSRTQEVLRNQKWVSCGIGRVIGGPAGGIQPGTRVVFVSPCAPTCTERVVVPALLVEPIDRGARVRGLEEGALRLKRMEEAHREAPWWEPARGHSSHSGAELDPHAAELIRKEALRRVLSVDWGTAERLETPLSLPREVHRPARPATHDRPTAVLFGYGNYAKTAVLPAVRRHLQLERIHEIDPTQIPLARRGADRDVAWDTAPFPRPDERADAFLIAGYHHTHAPLAVEALRRGAAAVIEKPIATTRAQLRELLRALDETGGRAFSCFQRRYHPFNDLARRHLRTTPGDPIDYHCVAYEERMPPLHWYRWPSSRSRLISNGCHWVDHFLFLNHWSPVLDHGVVEGPDGSLNASVSLENGAFFTLVLTDRGSDRTGMQDHVELRAGDVTVRIRNTARYEAEDGRRTLGRARTSRLAAYRHMYDSIARRITRGEPGDPRIAIEASTSLVLALDEDLQREAMLRDGPLALAAG